MCLKLLYPNTNIVVRLKKADDSFYYLNELEVDVNFDGVDPMFFRKEELDGIELKGPLAEKIVSSPNDLDDDISPVKKRSQRRLARLFKKNKK